MNQRPAGPGGAWLRYTADIANAKPPDGVSSAAICTNKSRAMSDRTSSNGMPPQPSPARRKACLAPKSARRQVRGPAAYFEPGDRTGKFRLGKDELIANENQESRISMEDYAIALVNELEKPEHRQRRFSVGY
jgi:hypothetical protein